MIRPVVKVTLASVLCVTALCVVAMTPAEARKKSHTSQSDSSDTSDSKTDKKSPAGKPALVATFGDWGAYLATGKTRTCYALASPKERKPDIKHDTAFVFISDRPTEKVHNEVSIIMGFPVKDNAAATAKVGTTNFDLVAKGSNAWIKNVADEKKFVEALQHSGKLVVKAAPTKGPATTDVYSLTGLKQALDRVGKDCK